MEKIILETKDIVSDNIMKIGQLFPNVVREIDGGYAIDFDELKQELSHNIIEGRKERFQMIWPGKKEAIVNANSKITKTLRPDLNKSENFSTTQNIYIEGDNLDSLKIMEESYLGKIKVIYIDPPYNTGNDFVYNDNFTMTKDEQNQAEGIIDEEGNKLVLNASSDGRYHSNWLSMMYPRLKIAKNMLTEDGVIFISIDENEYDNLKKLCDEIFGENNHATTFHLQVRYGNKMTHTSKNFSPLLEYVLVYTKNSAKFSPVLPCEEYGLDSFCFQINELTKGTDIEIDGQKITIFKSGEWEVIKKDKGSLDDLKETWVTGSIYSKMSYGQVFKKFIEPRFTTDGLGTLYKMHGRGEDGRGYRYYTGPQKKGATKGKMYSGVPLDYAEKIKNGEETKKYSPITTFIDYSADFGNIRNEGSVDFRAGKKPVKMLNNFLEMIDGDNYICMDFFSGSASTAHAVMHHNSVYNKNIKYIMVQLPESSNMETDYIKSGFNNICDIGEERIRRAAKKIKEETNADIDYGFRVFKVDSSNMKDEYYKIPNEIQQLDLLNMESNVKEERSDLDLLFQVILTLGLKLDVKVEEKCINNAKVYVIDDGQMIACFDKNLNLDIINEMTKIDDTCIKYVFREDCFNQDSDKINAYEIIKKNLNKSEKDLKDEKLVYII